MKALPAPSTGSSIRRHLMAGIVVVVLLVGGVGGWAATTEISGALIAPGQIVVDNNIKKVQHPTGGVVGAVLVHDGDKVKAGDVVVRLDETVTRANLAIVTKGLTELRARKARLEAERDGVATVTFPPELIERRDDPLVAASMASESRLFDLRRSARLGQKKQIGERIGQLHDEIGGLTAQQEAKVKEIALIERELKGVRDLYEKNLVQLARLTALEREATRLEGERGALIASVAQVRGKIAELDLQSIQIDQELSSEVARELRDVDGKIGEFVERKVTAEDQLKRIEIRAPQDGTVFQSNVHTVGGVVAAGDTIMMIVPAAADLTVEAKVKPQDIDQLHVGQRALLRFTTFNQRTTPEIYGIVTRISADITTDERSGLSYYTVRLSMSPQQIARLGDVKLVPGMPVEAFVQTGERTVMSYLVKPFYDQLTRAFREK